MKGKERKRKPLKKGGLKGNMWKIHSLRSSSSSLSSSAASSSIPFPPQHRTNGVRRSTTARHCTHFFMRLAQSAEERTTAMTGTFAKLTPVKRMWAESTYSHKRTCGRRAGTRPPPFCRSTLHTPQSADRHKKMTCLCGRHF